MTNNKGNYASVNGLNIYYDSGQAQTFSDQLPTGAAPVQLAPEAAALVGQLDMMSQSVPVGRRGCKLCRRVDVDRIGAQRSDRPVDDRSCLGSGH